MPEAKEVDVNSLDEHTTGTDGEAQKEEEDTEETTNAGVEPAGDTCADGAGCGTDDDDDDDEGSTDSASPDDPPAPADHDQPPHAAAESAASSVPSVSASASTGVASHASASTATATLAESQTRRLVALLDPPDDRPPDADDDLLCLGFNQDGGCLAVGTSSGFRVCNVCPFGETFRRTMGEDDDDAAGGEVSTGAAGSGGGASSGGGGGIGRISMLYRTNLLALVGGGPSPRYPPNKVLVWDDRLHRPIGELSFRKAVLNVLLRRDRVCVALRDRVYVYDFADLRLLDCVETGDNPRGLVCISTSAGSGGAGAGGNSAAGGWGGAAGGSGSGGGGGMVLACPGIPKGQVRVELYGYRKTLLIDAHEGNIAAMALTVDGTYLATASERGTVIRMFDTGLPRGRYGGASGGSTSAPAADGTPLREFRRGVERAHVSCLSFSLDGKWLGCASDRGTVHVFRAAEDEEDGDNARRRDGGGRRKKKSSSSFASPAKLASKFLPGVVSHSKRYFMEGEGSYAQVRGVPDPRACAFVPDRPETVAVAGLDEYGNGCLLIAGFGPGGGGGGKDNTAGAGSSGEAKRVGYHRFFRKAPLHSGAGAKSSKGGGSGKTKRTTSRSAGLGNRYPEEDDGSGAAGIASGMNNIVFGDDEADGDDGFVNVDTEGGPGRGGSPGG